MVYYIYHCKKATINFAHHHHHQMLLDYGMLVDTTTFTNIFLSLTSATVQILLQRFYGTTLHHRLQSLVRDDWRLR